MKAATRPSGQCPAVFRSLLYLLLRLLLGLPRTLRERMVAEADLEIVVLRHQLAILRRQVKRPVYRASDRTLWPRREGSYPKRRGGRSCSGPRRFSGGTATW